MDIILLEKVSKVGDFGDKVRVKAGFERNFLIPTGKALPATKKNVEFFEIRRAELEAAQNQRLEKAQARALALEGLSLTIAALSGDEGRLFGSVGAHEIVEAVKAIGHDIAKTEVRLLDGPFRQLGEYDVALSLSGEEVTAKIRITVIPA